jgi:hypothetical protein
MRVETLALPSNNTTLGNRQPTLEHFINRIFSLSVLPTKKIILRSVRKTSNTKQNTQPSLVTIQSLKRETWA